MYDSETLSKLVGCTVNKIRMNSEYLVFETDKGDVPYTVYGDCCSHSYFYDFIGVQKLLGQKITSATSVPMAEPDDKNSRKGDSVVAYGVRFRTRKGVAVMSFRNDSNGYYGGDMCSTTDFPKDLPEITSDVFDVTDGD